MINHGIWGVLYFRQAHFILYDVMFEIAAASGGCFVQQWLPAIRASFSLCRSWADWEVLVPLMSDKPWRVAECGCFTSLHHLSTSYCHVIGSVGCVHLVPMQYIHRSFCWTAKTFPPVMNHNIEGQSQPILKDEVVLTAERSQSSPSH